MQFLDYNRKSNAHICIQKSNLDLSKICCKKNPINYKNTYLDNSNNFVGIYVGNCKVNFAMGYMHINFISSQFTL